MLLTDVDAEALAEAAGGLSAQGDRLRPAPLDVSDRASIEAALSGIEDWAGLDGVVNNAAMLDISHAADVPEDRWSRVLEVNLTGALRVTQAALPLLRQSTSPAIVNAVAPGFIDTRMALTEDGRHEHELQDFRTHFIEAGRIPLRRPGKPEDCAGAFVFLLSDLSLYVTGQAICVDGGLSATY